MRTASGSPDPRGFALLEVLITAGILVAVAAGASQIVAIAIRAGHAARVRTMATMLAAQKMEQLRSLAWTHITAGSPPASVFSLSSSDATTDLSSDPATDAGPGLLPSPGGTLGANVPYYVDYLDGEGRWLGRGASPPGSAVYVRRWAVQPLAADPDNILVFHVLVTTRGAPGVGSSDAARLVTIEARK